MIAKEAIWGKDGEDGKARGEGLGGGRDVVRGREGREGEVG